MAALCAVRPGAGSELFKSFFEAIEQDNIEAIKKLAASTFCGSYYTASGEKVACHTIEAIMEGIAQIVRKGAVLQIRKNAPNIWNISYFESPKTGSKEFLQFENNWGFAFINENGEDQIRSLHIGFSFITAHAVKFRACTLYDDDAIRKRCI